VAGDEDLIDFLIQKSRPYIYTTATAPALCVATAYLSWVSSCLIWFCVWLALSVILKRAVSFGTVGGRMAPNHALIFTPPRLHLLCVLPH
jgi:hypothetical protein